MPSWFSVPTGSIRPPPTPPWGWSSNIERMSSGCATRASRRWGGEEAAGGGAGAAGGGGEGGGVGERRAPPLPVALAQPTAAALAHHESGLDPLLVSQSGGLSDGTIAGIAAVANKMGGQFVAFHRGLLRLEAVTRGGVEVQRAPSGYTYPLSASAVDPARAWPLLAEEVLAVLRRGEAVVGEAAARLRTAQVGDSFSLLGWDGTPSIVRVGAIVPDRSIDWFEVMV